MERLEILEPLAAADKRDRHADDRHDRQRRAAARVAVELRQHDAGDADPRVELARALDRVLPGHRVGDEQQVRRVGHVLDRDELGHQLVVDVQAAGGVDDHGVEARASSPRRPRPSRAPPDPSRPAGSCTRSAGLLRDDVQLLDRRRTLHVGRHQQRMLALLRQPLRQLARRRRLAGALQPEQQDDARPLRSSAGGRPSALPKSATISSRTILTTCCDGARLRSTSCLRRVHRPVADAIDERLDDLEIDVGFEQRETNLAQRRLDVLGRQPRLAAERLEDVLEACAEGIEHEPLTRSTANAYRSGRAGGVSIGASGR